ncbi:MAG: glycosyltransferase [Candidatus Pacebacteria bacterium]|nr:glycosyltransferase [Candidatus Paceibacterota bacterium]
MTKINASIVIYKNTKTQLQSVIDSVMKINDLGKLYIIDNSPEHGDRVKRIISSKDKSKIEYIHSSVNLGYGAAHNIAIRKSLDNNTDYHIVLNPDVSFDSQIIDELVCYSVDNNDVGLMMPQVLHKGGKVQYLAKLLPTPLDLFVRRFIPIKKIRDKFNYKYTLRHMGYNKIMDVPSLSGCFMFLRVNALRRVGLFDENIFLYMEDIDISRRIHSKYRTVYYPNVSIYHDYNKGSYKTLKLLICHIKSAIYYFNKWGWFFDKDRSNINKRYV